MTVLDIYNVIKSREIPKQAEIKIKVLGNTKVKPIFTRLGKFLNIVETWDCYEYAKCEHPVESVEDFLRYVEENSSYTDEPPVYLAGSCEPQYDKSELFATENSLYVLCIWVKPINNF